MTHPLLILTHALLGVLSLIFAFGQRLKSEMLHQRICIELNGQQFSPSP